MDWRKELFPGDWVVLSDHREAVIISKRKHAFWVEIDGVEGEQRYQMIEIGFIESISKNLEHWLQAV